MDFLFPLFVIVLIVVGLYLLTQSKIRVVPEEERLVIYRLGRFHRIVGPGPVVLQRSLDEVKRTFTVRDEPHNVRVNGLFMNGVPFGYTLNFWYRSDLKAAAGDNRERLVNLVQFSKEEREQQVATKVREALVTSAAKIEKSYQPAGNNFVHKLLPIIPGLPEFEALFAEVRQHLRATLPLVGAILNEAQPITVTNIHLGNDIVSSFSRGRIAALLGETFPTYRPNSCYRLSPRLKALTCHSSGWSLKGLIRPIPAWIFGSMRSKPAPVSAFNRLQRQSRHRPQRQPPAQQRR